MNKVESVQEYCEYIKNHTENIRKIWSNLQPFINKENHDLFLGEYGWYKLNKNINKHDDSKFSYLEFDNYRQWFFPCEDEEKDYNKFLQGWNHHQKVNLHHWNYWIMSDGVVLPMSTISIIEMLCDWSAMSLVYKDTPGEFYKLNTMNIHQITREKVERLLPIFDELVIEIERNNL